MLVKQDKAEVSSPYYLPSKSDYCLCLAMHVPKKGIGIAVVPAVLLALGMSFSPESPRWLFQQGKISEAEKSIKTLYGKERVFEVMQDLATTGGQSSGEAEAGWLDLFSSRYWRVVSVGVALFFFQQMAGINVVVYYSTAVFRNVGIASDVAASALVGAANVFGTTIASSLMDKQGLKSLLITSFCGMVCLFYFVFCSVRICFLVFVNISFELIINLNIVLKVD